MNAAIETALKALEDHPESATEARFYRALLTDGEFAGDAYDMDEIIESLEEDAAPPKLAVIPDWRSRQQKLIQALLDAVKASNETGHELDTVEVSALINHYYGRQASLHAADGDAFTERGVRLGYLERFGKESARLTEAGREWVRVNILPHYDE